MTIIQLEVEDRLIEVFGVKTVKNFMEKQLAALRLQYLGEKIAEHIRQSGADHNKELAEARQEAWQEYKEKHLKDML